MSETVNLVLSLNTIATQLARYLSIFILICGTIGNMLNIIVFLQRSLRSNPCSIYFLSSSVSSLFALFFGLITRILATYQLDPTNESPALCKIRNFLMFSTLTTSTWFIALASIDRYFISCQNVKRRQLSGLKNTYYLVGILTVLTMLIYGEIFYCFEANLSTPPSPIPCYFKNYPCRLYNDLTFVVIVVLVPGFIMLVFGYLTVLNVRKLKLLVDATSSTQNDTKKMKKSDRQLIQMLLVQVVLITMLGLPIAIQRLYATFTIYLVKTQLQLSIENFAYRLLLLFTFISMSIPFYLYLLTSTLFRQTFMNLFRKYLIYRTTTTQIRVSTLNTKQNAAEETK
ncbi:unnamed protein product [Didymodactylos carnosus]|uniref:G-protein coupled receptors family 1 profile domain-containing protein n=1 Tax=Didymodactylos carnosus TaxID=1234261 RepID=A0A814PUG6_9BILA|nr:unnamed protein product [Didymodactylos carnosus]CAF1110549.1 unnamed protein product [Didymodactylos carnosus]CAF3869670.1 unnamed protein product [Didymodactylos carnosus]CAF3874964.1 unnamed protein product [Didymodactylos carnosus]